MIKNLFMATMILVAPAVYAQNQALYECIYQYDVNGETEKGKLSETYDCMLLIGEENSKFLDYAAFQLDSVSAIKGIDEEIIQEYQKRDNQAKNYFDRRIFYSMPKEKLTITASMAPSHYQYDEKTPIISWTLSEETENICGYECKKAEGEYGGRSWTVWYAEDIAVPFGPWKLIGLPGLVMKATDSENIHTFSAISFREGNSSIFPDKIPNVIKMDHDKFEKAKNNYDKDPFKAINPQDITHIEVTKNKGLLINGVPLRKHDNGFIPLELPTK